MYETEVRQQHNTQYGQRSIYKNNNNNNKLSPYAEKSGAHSAWHINSRIVVTQSCLGAQTKRNAQLDEHEQIIGDQLKWREEEP